MPAFSGEPWRGRARVEVTDGVATARFFIDTEGGFNVTGDVADANFWDRLPGESLTLTFGYQLGTVALANPYHFATVQVATPGGGAVGSSWRVPSSGSLPTTGTNAGFATRTLHFDDNPLDQSLSAALRAGTLELVITMHRDADPDLNDHTINTRGGTAGTIPPNTTFTWARGYARARWKLASYASGATRSGGVPQAPPNGPGGTPLFAYKDNIEQRVTVDAQPYRANAVTLALLNGTTTRRSESSSVSSGSTTVDLTHSSTSGTSARANNDFTANARPSVRLEVGGSNPFPGGGRSAIDSEIAWAASGHPSGWTASQGTGLSGEHLRLESSTAFVAPIDGRVSFTSHMQLNDPAFALSKAAASNVRLESQQANIWARSLDARGNGVNTVLGESQRFTFRDPFGVVKVNDVLAATITQDSQAGWRNGSITWTDALPGGTWVLDVSHSDAGNTQTQGTAQFSFVLLALDLQTALTASRQGSKDHPTDGSTLTVCLSLVRADNGQRLTPTAADVMLLRYTAATGQEHFNGTAWVPTGSSAGTWLALTAHPADALTFQRAFNTTGWGFDDILVIGRGLLSGSAFADQVTVEMVGAKNLHAKQAFDPTGLFA